MNHRCIISATLLNDVVACTVPTLKELSVSQTNDWTFSSQSIWRNEESSRKLEFGRGFKLPRQWRVGAGVRWSCCFGRAILAQDCAINGCNEA